MGIRDFDISTNHPFNKYKSGQTVRGNVHFKLHTAKIIRGIYVRFRGIAKVEWEESRKTESFGKEITTYVRYSGEHEYFNENIYLIGAPDGESFDLAVGEHNYKFEYNLPVGLPTSFEGSLGSILYTIRAVIDIPWSIDDDVEIKLKVMSSIDLNTMPQLKNPGYMTESKQLCCWWCRTGPITVEVHIPKTGYASGEVMHIKADVENLSNANITMFECKVKQKVTYHSEYPERGIKQLETVLCSGRFDGVLARCLQTYDKTLTIPEGPVVNFNNCSLFSVQHSFKIKLYIDGCHFDLSAKIPITLGTIPLMLDEPPKPPVSILAGLGSPYPYETRQQNSNLTEAGSSHMSNDQYGWMISAKETEQSVTTS